MKTVLMILIIFCCISCGLFGNHRLGNNFSLLEGDRTEDRIIVYCTDNLECQGGVYVVPVYSRHMDSTGDYAEYVEAAVSNRNWIAAKTIEIKTRKHNYWLIDKNVSLDGVNCQKINCDSLLQSHVTGPMDSAAFQNKTRKLGIDLDFK